MKKKINIGVKRSAFCVRQTAFALIAAAGIFCVADAWGLTAEQQELADELANVDPATGSFIYGEVNFEKNGVQAASAEMTGLDNTPNSRVWNIAFLTDLSTYRKGFRLFVR
jgi:hypothetical protein